MKVMVKEARSFSSDVEYPENTKEGNDGSAQVRLPQELFEKYKGKEFSALITFKYKWWQPWKLTVPFTTWACHDGVDGLPGLNCETIGHAKDLLFTL